MEFIKKYWKEILIGILTVVAIALAMSTSCTVRKNNELEINMRALTDSVHVMEMRNGDLLYEKQGMILEKEELEKYLSISRNEVKELEKALKSKVAYISKLEGVVKVDTLIMHDSILYKEDTLRIYFDYADDYLAMNGETEVVDSTSSTTMNNLSVNVPLTVGVTEDSKIFVRTSNPYVDFTNIEGAQLQTPKTKKKQWNLGIQGGFGGQYDIIHKTFGVGPYLGIGVSWGWDF